jgi:hypothetical protein
MRKRCEAHSGVRAGKPRAEEKGLGRSGQADRRYRERPLQLHQHFSAVPDFGTPDPQGPIHCRSPSKILKIPK